MKFAEYQCYKRPETYWLEHIPAKWDSIALGRLFRRVERTGFADEELLSVYRDYGVVPKNSRDDNFNTASEDLSPYQLVNPGELVMNKMKAWQGSIAISQHRGIVSPAYFVYEPWLQDDMRMYSKYIHYLLRSPIYIAQYLSRSKGIRVNQWDLDPEAFQRIEVLLPSLTEQKQIAAFLDYETAKIDALIEKQQQLIALLGEKRQAVISHAVTKGLNPDAPMRDSGVELIGAIPQHWVVLPLQRVVQERRRITYGIVQPGRRDENGRFMIRNQDFTNGWADPEAIFRVSDGVEIPYARARFQSGDLLMTIVGAGIGNVSKIPDWLDGANTTQNIARIAVDPTKAHPDFIAAVLGGPIGRQWIEYYSKGAAQPSLNLAHLCEFKIPLPPLDEQDSISAYIQSLAAPMDNLLYNSEQAIQLLNERRTALISAAVAGKIDVRGWKRPPSDVRLNTEMEVA